MQLAVGTGLGLHHPAWNELAEDRAASGVSPQEFHRAGIPYAQAIEKGGDRVAAHDSLLGGEARHGRGLSLEHGQLDGLLYARLLQAGHAAPGSDAESRQHGQGRHHHQGNAYSDPADGSGGGGGLR